MFFNTAAVVQYTSLQYLSLNTEGYTVQLGWICFGPIRVRVLPLGVADRPQWSLLIAFFGSNRVCALPTGSEFCSGPQRNKNISIQLNEIAGTPLSPGPELYYIWTDKGGDFQKLYFILGMT